MPSTPEAGNKSDQLTSPLLEQVIQKFEQAWQSGVPPAMDEVLPTESARRIEILIELIPIDQECRFKANAERKLEEYLQDYPELEDDREIVLALIASEYRLRQRLSEPRGVDEYVSRFPQYAAELRKKLLQSALLPSS